ncbi:MAG: hypothetical protein ACKPCI_05800 [Dolichospermum sp.]
MPQLIGFSSFPAATFSSSLFWDTFTSGNQIGITGTPAVTTGVTVPFTTLGLPLGGFSSMQVGNNGTYWFQPDNGYGQKPNSGDFLLRNYQVNPILKTASNPTGGSVEFLNYIQYRDPDKKIRPIAKVRSLT